MAARRRTRSARPAVVPPTPSRWPRWLAPAAAAVGIVWAAVVVGLFVHGDRAYTLDPKWWWSHWPPLWQMQARALADSLWLLVKLALLLVVLLGVGRALLRRLFGWTDGDRFEQLGCSLGLGLGAVSLTMLVLAVCQLWYPVAVWAATAAALAAAIVFNRDLIVQRSSPPPPAAGWTTTEKILAGVLGAVLLPPGLFALAPELFFDALVYHLALPKLYQLEHGLLATPHNVYAGFPQLIEMVDGWALFFADERLCRLLHWCMAGGCALLLAGSGRRRGRPTAGWIAALVFVGTPLVSLACYRCGVDVGGALLVLCALAAAATAVDASGAVLDRRRWVLTALFAGLALSVKYLLWPLLAVWLLVFALQRVPARQIAHFALIAGALLLPWLVRNSVLYGNPIFPFYDELFAAPAAPPANWRALQADAWGRQWLATLGDARQLLALLLQPWTVTMQGASDADMVGPLYLASAPLLLWALVRDRGERLLALWAIGAWIAWCALSRMPRLFIPGLALCSLWIGCAVAALPARWLRQLAAALAVVFALRSAVIVAETERGKGSWSVISGAVSRSDYLATGRPSYPTPIFRGAEWIGQYAARDARVLVVGDGRGYQLPRPFIAASLFAADPFWQEVAQSPSADELHARLRQRGVTHLLFNLAELIRLRPSAARQACLDQAELLAEFMARHARECLIDASQPQQSMRWSAVYELVEAEAEPTAQRPLLRDWCQRFVAEPVRR